MNDQTNEKQSWWQRLSGGLKRTSSSIGGAVNDLVAKRRLDQTMLDDIEDVLIRADLGVETAARIAAAVGEGRYDKSITADEVKAVVAAEVEKVLTPVAKPLMIKEAKPFVALVIRHWSQWLGQDHYHRQDRRQAACRGSLGDACRRGYLPRRRH